MPADFTTGICLLTQGESSYLVIGVAGVWNAIR